MFPKTLDDAEVIYYTAKSTFREVYYSTGEIYDTVYYLAICKYPNTSDEYYLFGCNDTFEVVEDSVWGSISTCMEVASNSFEFDIQWLRA